MLDARSVVLIGGPSITLLGVIVGVMGTLMICKPYHPFSYLAFVRHLLGVIWAFRRGAEEATRLIRIASQLGAVNEEDRANSLMGVYVVFFGFVLQAIGAVLSGINAILANPFSTP